MAIKKMMDETTAKISDIHGLRLPPQDLGTILYVRQGVSWRIPMEKRCL